jgi:hypothetical protein
MKEALESGEASEYPGEGLYLVPWKCDATNEAAIKHDCKATNPLLSIGGQSRWIASRRKVLYSGVYIDETPLTCPCLAARLRMRNVNPYYLQVHRLPTPELREWATLGKDKMLIEVNLSCARWVPVVSILASSYRKLVR